MMRLLDRLDEPLFYWDRRMTWNAHKRARWTAVTRFVPKVKAAMSQEDEVRQAGMQAIGFLKLSAIVSAGVTPLFFVFYLLISSVQQANLAQHREALVKDMDSRYVSRALDDVRMAENAAQIADNTAINRSQEQRINALELRIQQLETTRGGRR